MADHIVDSSERDHEQAIPLLTPLWHHRERNTVQLGASHGKENPLDMRDLQACVNPCNALFITRNEQG
jgi:hypothetical protein